VTSTRKDLTFNVLGPVGDIVSEWIIKGALITDQQTGVNITGMTENTAVNINYRLFNLIIVY
jgi:hypothetical protein